VAADDEEEQTAEPNPHRDSSEHGGRIDGAGRSGSGKPANLAKACAKLGKSCESCRECGQGLHPVAHHSY
jgi:hypothetical protein